jgi:tripartite-type tricarboxylate transporter receptor subunit TctC
MLIPSTQAARSRNLHAVRLVSALALSGLLGTWAGTVRAEYPDRPIRLIVPFQPGSISDNIARILAAKFNERLGWQMVVEARVGGSSIVGTDAVARSAPDGYTIGLANTTSHAASAGLSAKLPFDPVKDFTPFGVVGSSPFVLVASTHVPAANMGEFIALAKSRPGKLSYASAGTATMAHLAGELFKKVADVDIAHIPYRGTGQSVVDLIEGRVDLLVGTIPGTAPFIRDGKLRGLAVMSQTRNAALPDVPTVAEVGVPGCEAALWTALVLPAGAPPEIVARLSRELMTIVALPDVQESLRSQGVEPEVGSAAVAAARIKADVAKWGDVIRRAHIGPQAQ